MKKDELIGALHDVRRQFLEAIAGLDEEALSQPGVTGTWSIRDVIAHLNMWESETVTLLFQARQGQKPTTVHFQPVSDDEQNAKWHEITKERTVPQVLNDFEGVRKQTLRRLGDFRDAELENKGQFPWLKNHSLGELVWDYTGAHEKQHAEMIEQWKKRS